jgi:hypothetical protein
MRRPVALLAVLVAASCRPDFGERESRVDRTQVVAVVIEPPEAKPGEPVTSKLVVASPDGPVLAPATGWAFCATPKLLTENGAVSAACLGDGVVPIGDAAGTVTATLPGSGCSDFGPETVSADVRPRDADVTGGYFAPIRARFADPRGADVVTAFGFARLTCDLGGAPADAATAFRAQYRANANPVLLPVEATLEGTTSPVALEAVPQGARVVLRASWPAASAEAFAVFDVATQAVVTRRESLRVSWFATAGELDRDRTGRAADELETFTENAWRAPDEPRITHLWVVLRDARGGTATAALTLTTR